MGTTSGQKNKIPELRFCGFEAAWSKQRIDDLLTRVSEPVEINKDREYHQIGIRSHGKGLFYKDSVKGDELGNKRVYWVKPDMFIVNIVFAWEQAVAKTTKNDIGMVASHRFPMYQPVKEKLDLDFILFFFLRPRGKYLLEVASPGGAGRNKTLGQQTFNEIKITVPTYEEQSKIADFLGSVDAWLDNLRKQKTALETYKRGMMQKFFTQQVRFKDENGKDFPEWERNKLGEIEDRKAIKLGRGEVISKRDIVSNPGDYPIYSSSVKDIALFGRYGSYMFDEELITWSVDGGGHFFYRPKHKFSVTNVSGWMRVLSGDIVTRFLSYQLQFHHAKLVFDYSTKAHPSVIRNIYTINLPIKEEQEKIVDFLTALDEMISAKSKEITKVEQWKKGLMQKMFV
jgi:type I restriction enzyme, S subunit